MAPGKEGTGVQSVVISTLRKFLDEQEQASVHDRLRGLDLLHLAVEGGPTHAPGLVDGIADTSLRSEALAALERLVDGPVIGALALRAIGEAMGLAGGKEPVPGRLVELGDEIAALGADPPPAAAPKGWGVVASSTV